MILPNEKIIFIHVPKTGGVSIENFFIKLYGYERNPLLLNHSYGVFIDSNNDRATIYPHMHCTLPQVLQIAKQNKIQVDNTWTIFSIIRNPYFKLISDFFYQDVLPFKYHYHTLPEVNKKSFIDYWVEVYFRSDKNLNYHSNHSLPQYKFFENCDLECKIFKFEEGLDTAIKSLGFPITEKFPRDLDPAIVFNIPKPDYKELLTKYLIETVNEKYSRDFKEFGYEMLNPLDFA